MYTVDISNYFVVLSIYDDGQEYGEDIVMIVDNLQTALDYASQCNAHRGDFNSYVATKGARYLDHVQDGADIWPLSGDDIADMNVL